MSKRIAIFVFLLHGLLMSLQNSYASSIGITVNGSESIQPSKTFSYELRNLTDNRVVSAWCTKKHQSGKAWIELSTNIPDVWDGFGLINGYARTKQSFQRNSRAKIISVYADGNFFREFSVSDTSKPQWFDLAKVSAKSLKLSISNVYEGEQDNDLCISEIFINKSIVKAWSNFDDIAQQMGNHALSAVEIKKLYQPLLKGAVANESSEASFLHALSLYTYGQNEVGLRMLLNMLFQEHQGDVLRSEFVEGLAGLVVRFFEFNPKAVMNVWNDKQQLMLERISNAYIQFIDPFDEEGLRKYKQNHEDFRMLAALIEKSLEPGS